LLGLATARAIHPDKQNYDVQPYHVDLTKNVPHMFDLIRDTQLSDEPEYPGLGDSASIDLDVLTSLRKQWLTGFDWKIEQESLNK
jgi:hypothetical protein